MFVSVVCMIGLVVGGCPAPTPNPAQGGAGNPVKFAPAEDEGVLLAEIDKDFSNAELHYRLGRVYHQKGKAASAEFEYERALVFDPLFFDAQAALVKLWQDSGNSARAAQETDRYIDRAGNAKNLVGLGTAFQGQGMMEQAKRCFELAIQREPGNAIAYKQLGHYYLSKNDKTNATQMFTKSFELDPYQADVAKELGRLGITVKARVAPLPVEKAQPAGQGGKATAPAK
jgi:Tfp pilus assembly protein PilF